MVTWCALENLLSLAKSLVLSPLLCQAMLRIDIATVVVVKNVIVVGNLLKKLPHIPIKFLPLEMTDKIDKILTMAKIFLLYQALW